MDAFLEREFTGTVKQVRLNPTIQQNVVSYNVIVAVPNDDNVLLPGMTANVRFAVNQKKDVLRVPNAALRYKPREDSDGGKPAPRELGKHSVYRIRLCAALGAPDRKGGTSGFHAGSPAPVLHQL